jgi:hypothetical protein
MGKEVLTCGPGVSAGERKRGEWEIGRRWKAGSDRWEAEAGAADAGRPMGCWATGEGGRGGPREEKGEREGDREMGRGEKGPAQGEEGKLVGLPSLILFPFPFLN